MGLPMNKLFLSAEAQNDLDEIKAYITKTLGNPTAARSILRQITQDIRTLTRFPLLGTPLSSVSKLSCDYRFLVTGSYLTFYHISNSTIYIDRVLYGRRNYLSCLFDGLPEPDDT